MQTPQRKLADPRLVPQDKEEAAIYEEAVSHLRPIESRMFDAMRVRAQNPETAPSLWKTAASFEMDANSLRQAETWIMRFLQLYCAKANEDRYLPPYQHDNRMMRRVLDAMLGSQPLHAAPPTTPAASGGQGDAVPVPPEQGRKKRGPKKKRNEAGPASAAPAFPATVDEEDAQYRHALEILDLTEYAIWTNLLDWAKGRPASPTRSGANFFHISPEEFIALEEDTSTLLQAVLHLGNPEKYPRPAALNDLILERAEAYLQRKPAPQMPAYIERNGPFLSQKVITVSTNSAYLPPVIPSAIPSGRTQPAPETEIAPSAKRRRGRTSATRQAATPAPAPHDYSHYGDRETALESVFLGQKSSPVPAPAPVSAPGPVLVPVTVKPPPQPKPVFNPAAAALPNPDYSFGADPETAIETVFRGLVDPHPRP